MNLGDRMKKYEAAETERVLLPRVPAIVRLDGRHFHSFTRNMRRPFDERMSRAMVETMRQLVVECSAVLGYTQSDEISLVLYWPKAETQAYFGGRMMKMASCLAAFASVHFLDEIRRTAIVVDDFPTFDCRIFNVPDLEEAANAIRWRERDATKNSISMAAQSVFSVNELHGKNGSEMQEMLFQKGINWNDYPTFFKRGTYVRRVVTSEPFSAAELADLPEKHEARRNPNLLVERGRVEVLEILPLDRIANAVDVLFHGAAPVARENEKEEA